MGGHFVKTMEARAKIKKTLKPGTEAYYLSDTELARRTGLSPPTVRKLRQEMGIPSREERIMAVVGAVGMAYLDDYLAKLPGVTYHCLYMLLKLRGTQYLKRSK